MIGENAVHQGVQIWIGEVLQERHVRLAARHVLKEDVFRNLCYQERSSSW
jgi:hypothetical protein